MRTLLQKTTGTVPTAIRHAGSQRLLAVAFMLSFASAAFVERAYNSSSVESAHSRARTSMRPAGRAAATLPVQQTTASEPVRVVKFSLFDAGIYPRETHVDKGLVAITIEDYSGSSPGVIVDRETGAASERAGRIDRAGPHWRFRNEMRLGPGRYRVYMVDRPANQSLLVVEP